MEKNRMNKFSKRRFFLIPGICTLILFCTAIFLMNHYSKKMIESHVKENNDYLSEINKQIATTIDNRIYTNQVLINSISTMIGITKDFESKEISESLKTERIKHNLIRIAIIKPNGNYTEDGKTINVSSRTYFQEALKGNSSVSDILTSRLTGENIIVYSTPIKNGKEITGVLLGVQSVKSLRENLAVHAFNNNGFTRIIDKNGNYVISTDSEDFTKKNIYDEINKNWDDVEFAKSRMENIIKERKSGVFRYKNNFTSIYTPIKYNDWVLFSMLPSNVMENVGHTHLYLILCLLIGIILLIHIRTQMQIVLSEI